MSTITPPRPSVPRPGAPRSGRPAGQISAPSIDPFRVLRRHWLGITASVLIGGLIGVVVHFACDKLYPLYPGEVYFEVRSGVEDPSKLGHADMGQDDAVTRMATTETVLLLSRPVLTEAMKSRDILTTDWHARYLDDNGTFSIDDAVDDLVEELTAGPVRNSNLFSLQWSDHEARDIPIVLNTISRAYITRRTIQDSEVFNKNLKVFEEQLASTNSQLDDLSEQISSFIKDKGINSLDDPRFSQTSLAVTDLVERITGGKQDLSVIQSMLVQTAAKLEGTTAPTSEDILAAEQHPIILRYDSEILTVKTELVRRRDKYPGGHPAIIELERQLQSMDETRARQIHDIITKNLTGMLKEMDDRRQTIIQLVQELEDEYESKDKQLRDLAADSSTYMDMHARRTLLEEKRSDDLDLIRDLQLMRLRADAVRVRLAQEADTPREKSFPQIEYVIPLVTLLVVALTIGGIFIRELTDHRVKSASDLAVIPGARVLGVIPDLADDPTEVSQAEMVLRKHPHSVVAESYRQAIAPIMKAMTMAGHQSLLLVGGLPECGTTTVATNIALASAAAGKRVVVIDGNFRRPQLPDAFGVSAPGPGLADLVNKTATIDKAIVPIEENIDLIPAGNVASGVFERLNDNQFSGAIMAELRTRYDLIIIDTPPTVVAGDAITLASKVVDAAVIVVRANQEQRGLVARMISQFADTHCDLLGIVLNRARGTVGGYFRKNFETMAEYAQND